MGVSSLVNRVPYVGDGSTVSFAFAYYFFAQADLLVYKYDTILGGITTMVLNTDYTVSGTANAQGLYPSGANVVCTTAPLSTDILVIIRNPSEVQNYALLQNGQVSSVALVQQLDYLTLLVQRLEDQVSRCIQLPDGVGPTFSNQLPPNAVLTPGGFVQVNPGGNGWLLTPSPQLNFSSVVFPYTAFQGASGTEAVTAFILPAGCMLTGLVIKHTSPFAGTSLSAIAASLGVSGTPTQFINSFDVKQAIGDTVIDSVLTSFISSFVNPTNILLTLVGTGANLSALSQGSVTVFYNYIRI